MNNQSVSLVATTNIKQDRQKIWQPTVGEVLVVLKAANKQESPPPPLVQTKKIVCIEQIVARQYVRVPCNLALAPLILVNYSVQFYFLVRDDNYALLMLWSCFDHDHTHKHHFRL